MTGRRVAARLAPALALGALTAAACGAPELGPLPARCSDGVCPEGYACIHEVCAAPGTAVPITVTRAENLRGVDLRLIPEPGGGALAVWQTYAYSPEGQRFRAARVSAAGEVSEPMDLVTSFVADEGAAEPFYDVLAVSGQDLLLAVSAAPLPSDASPSARLLVYRAKLPPAGQEARGVQFEAAWSAEERMDTAGYGAVSRPKLLLRDDHVELGYVRTRVPASSPSAEVIGELGVFRLGLDGAQLGAPDYYPVRAGRPVAVGVVGAFHSGGITTWVLDDARPSAVVLADGGLPAEVPLARLGVALEATEGALHYLEPSARTGDKRPTDPVAGGAVLRRIAISPQAGDPPFTFQDEALGALAPVRDTPRPAWVSREGAPALLVTPGAAVDAPALLVYEVDPAAGAAPLGVEAARVERFSSAQVGAVEAALASGHLVVAWIDVTDAAATVRMAILPEP